METVDCLVTGRIRSAPVLSAALYPLIQLRNQGVFRRVILSLWSDDVVSHSDVVANFQAHGVVLVENGSGVPIRSVGNYWEQVKTLESGLNEIEDSVNVFKTRTDILYFGGIETIKKIVKDNVGVPSGRHGFKQKIWIPSLVAFWPFFMADQCFLGLTADLRRFIRYDAAVEAKSIEIAMFPGSTSHFSAASPEIRFWIQPFIDEYPLLREYGDIWPYSMNGYPVYPAIQEYLLNSPLYQEYLAVYWKIVCDAFLVSEGKFCIAQGIDENSQVQIRARSPENNSINLYEEASQLKIPFPVSFSTDAGVRLLAEGGQNVAFREEFRQAWNRVQSYSRTEDRIRQFGTLKRNLLSLVRM